MRVLNTAQRRSQIVRLLLDNGSVRIGELSRQFGVSSETIRKDLIELEKQGLATKGHGMARAPGGASVEENHSAESQMRIAYRAFDEIEKGDSIILDGGSNCYLLARKLIDEKFDAKVITCSLPIAKLLADNEFPVNILGGEVDKKLNTVSLWAEYCLSMVSADKAFLETAGFAGRTGPCSDSFAEAQIKRAIIRASKKVLLLAEGVKAGESSLVEFAAWENFDVLITDSFITMEALDALKDKIEIRLAY